jgi:hypothetical protein
MKASGQQIKIIHTLKSRLKLDESDYRALLSSYGVESSKELSYLLAKELVSKLQTRAEAAQVSTPKEKRFDKMGERPGMATPAQLRKIEVCWMEVSRAPTDDAKRKALVVFLRNHFEVSALEWISSDMASKVIRTIQAMKKQKGT